MAAKDGIAIVGRAAAEKLLRSLMPELLERFESFQKQLSQLDQKIDAVDKKIDVRSHELERRIDAVDKTIDVRTHELARQIDASVHELEVKMYEKLEQARDVFNELGQRIGQVDARLKSYIDINRDQTAAYKDLIERVVRMETLQDARPPAKASRRRAS